MCLNGQKTEGGDEKCEEAKTELVGWGQGQVLHPGLLSLTPATVQNFVFLTISSRDT